MSFTTVRARDLPDRYDMCKHCSSEMGYSSSLAPAGKMENMALGKCLLPIPFDVQNQLLPAIFTILLMKKIWTNYWMGFTQLSGGEVKAIGTTRGSSSFTQTGISVQKCDRKMCNPTWRCTEKPSRSLHSQRGRFEA